NHPLTSYNHTLSLHDALPISPRSAAKIELEKGRKVSKGGIQIYSMRAVRGCGRLNPELTDGPSAEGAPDRPRLCGRFRAPGEPWRAAVRPAAGRSPAA